MRNLMKLAVVASGFLVAASGVVHAESKALTWLNPDTNLVQDSGWTVSWSDEFEGTVDLIIRSANENFASFQKNVTFADKDGAVGPLDLTFTANGAASSVEFRIEGETIINETDRNWSGFEISAFSDSEFEYGLNQGLAEYSGFNGNPFSNRTFNDISTAVTFDGATLSSTAPDNELIFGNGFGSILSFGVGAPSEVPALSITLREQPILAAPVVVVPLPPAAWMGLTTLIGAGAFHAMRRARATV